MFRSPALLRNGHVQEEEEMGSQWGSLEPMETYWAS